MQLNRLVTLHKALGDPTRIRILVLLAKGPLHGQALAGKLGVTPPTITHHMAKLREAGVVSERRDKNTIYFRLNEPSLSQGLQGTLKMILKRDGLLGMADAPAAAKEANTLEAERERQQVLKNFFTADGRLKHLPAKHKKKLFVLEHMVSGFEMGKKYSEQDVNERILRFHEDYATIRREFIIHQYMYRENGMYELNPREMWPQSTKLG